MSSLRTCITQNSTGIHTLQKKWNALWDCYHSLTFLWCQFQLLHTVWLLHQTSEPSLNLHYPEFHGHILPAKCESHQAFSHHVYVSKYHVPKSKHENLKIWLKHGIIQDIYFNENTYNNNNNKTINKQTNKETDYLLEYRIPGTRYVMYFYKTGKQVARAYCETWTNEVGIGVKNNLYANFEFCFLNTLQCFYGLQVISD